MKVRDLIEKLSKLDQELDVVVEDNDCFVKDFNILRGENGTIELAGPSWTRD